LRARALLLIINKGDTRVVIGVFPNKRDLTREDERAASPRPLALPQNYALDMENLHTRGEIKFPSVRPRNCAACFEISRDFNYVRKDNLADNYRAQFNLARDRCFWYQILIRHPTREKGGERERESRVLAQTIARVLEQNPSTGCSD